MEHLGQRNKSHHFLFSTLLFLFNPTRPLPRYIFQLSPYPKIGTSPFATFDDLFYYLVDLLAATVYWNPHRSEIMRRATRPDARVTKRIIIGNEMNYRELKESVKKKKKEKQKYIENKVPRIFPFRDSISGFCCFALSAHTERLDVYRNYSFAGSTYRDRGGGDRVPQCLSLLRFIGPSEIFVWESWIKLCRIVVRVELETPAFFR